MLCGWYLILISYIIILIRYTIQYRICQLGDTFSLPPLFSDELSSVSCSMPFIWLRFQTGKEGVLTEKCPFTKMNYTTIWYHFGINVYGLIIGKYSIIVIVGGLAAFQHSLCRNNLIIRDNGHLPDSLAGTVDGQMPETKITSVVAN